MAPATPSSARSAAADGAAATSTAMPAAPASHARRAAEPDSAAAAQASHSSTSWVDGSTSEAAGGRREPAAAAAPPKESCIKHMDAIWFCYSPVYQTTQYYREGAFDSCVGKWGDLWDCMLLRTAAAPAVMARREERQRQQDPVPAHIWQMRTPEQAREFWEQEFGKKS